MFIHVALNGCCGLLDRPDAPEDRLRVEKARQVLDAACMIPVDERLGAPCLLENEQVPIPSLQDVERLQDLLLVSGEQACQGQAAQRVEDPC